MGDDGALDCFPTRRSSDLSWRRTMQTVGVIGAGQMGAGIAQVAAQAGYTVLLSDMDRARAEAGKAGIGKQDRKSTRLNSSHGYISYAVFCLQKKKNTLIMA